MVQQACTFQGQIIRMVCLKYLLYLPEGYGVDPDREWPFILFLHGMGERGDNLELIKKHGIPRIVENRDDFPFVTVSPQCPIGSWWQAEADALDALLDEVLGKYRIDPDRVYLTGLSMGGFGTWHLAAESPERFAAIAPICGGGNPARASALKNVPAWVFRGAKDSVVPLNESEEMVKALKACGGDVRFTIYPEAEHDSWTQTYSNPELYEWFLHHTRRNHPQG